MGRGEGKENMRHVGRGGLGEGGRRGREGKGDGG